MRSDVQCALALVEVVADDQRNIEEDPNESTRYRAQQ